MEQLVHIQNADIAVKEYNGQRVVTFKDVDAVHGRPDGTARATFNRNKEHFVEGRHYFVCETYEAKEVFGVNAPNGLSLLTEKGYLMLVKPFNDELSWEVQEQLVESYFRVHQIANDLSPQMQILYGMLDQMAQTERQAKEAKLLAEKAVEATENIKEAVKPVFDNWREEIGKKIKRIQYSCGTDFKTLNTEMYSDLERRAGCDLSTRLRNKKQRMHDAGCTKTEIENTRKIDIIEEDKRLREIFTKIVSEYEIKYCA